MHFVCGKNVLAILNLPRTFTEILCADWGKIIYCGWNIHHILPLSCGGTNEKHNLICTNIYTNDEAEDKITYWIDDCLYQVQKVYGTREHQIVKLN